MLKVCEIFYSIQGESLHAGLPCVFIRLAGCNLKCSYCDTLYAHDSGIEMSCSQILDSIRKYQCFLVEFTGGEPLMQSQTPYIVKKLLDLKYTVLIETNGSFDIGCLDQRCVKIVDIKCLSSGHSKDNNLNNLKKLSPYDQLKFVMQDKKDYEYAKNFLKQNKPDIPKNNIIFSPVWDKLKPFELAKWILHDNLHIRLQIQLHRIIWPDIDRGV